MPRKEKSKETNNVTINNLTIALDKIKAERNDTKDYDKFTYPLTENGEINFIVYSGIKSKSWNFS